MSTTPTSTSPAIPDFPAITDAAIRTAIEAAIDGGRLDPEFDGYEGWAFEQTLAEVSGALRDSDLFGDYRVYMVLDHDAGEGTTGGGQVLVRVPGGPTVSGPAAELRHLTNDRAATGIDGLMAIAQVIVSDAQGAVKSLRAWVNGTPLP